jgi:hypothetical protein
MLVKAYTRQAARAKASPAPVLGCVRSRILSMMVVSASVPSLTTMHRPIRAGSGRVRHGGLRTVASDAIHGVLPPPEPMCSDQVGLL